MSDILIDVSYLSSAYKCLRGKAVCNADIVNFYRFLGELIANKTVYIKVNKNGPVYEHAAECIAFLNQSNKQNFEIQFLNPEKINYQKLIGDAATNLKYFNTSIFFSEIKHNEDVSPVFNTSSYPDSSFHEWLMNGKKNLPKYILDCNNGTYAPILLGSRLGFIDFFKEFKKNNWTLEKSIALAAQMRSLIYIEMGKEFGLTYVPSATRGYNSSYSFNSPSVRNLLFEDIDNYKDFKHSFKSNTNIISGIICRNNCIPIDCLKDVFVLRKKTEKLRNYLYKKPMLKSGDSLILYQYEKLRELQKIRDEYLVNGKLLFDLDDLNPAISTNSIDSSPSMDVAIPIVKGTFKFLDFNRKRRLLKKMKSLLLPIVQASFLNPTKLLKTLKTNSGLNE